MQRYLIDGLVLAPILFGLAAWAIRPYGGRALTVALSALLIIAGGIGLAAQASFPVVVKATVPHVWAGLATVVEPLIVAAVIFIGCRIRSRAVVLMAAAQMVLTLATLFAPTHGGTAEHAAPVFVIDSLAVIMVLIISVIGSLIVLFAIGYMRKHEEHAPKTAASTGRFFFFLIAFLGLMNGLVLTDDLRWLCIFWEGTTLCSFFLIGHEGNEESKASARRALLINTFGGLVMTGAAWASVRATGSESLGTAMAGSLLIPLAFLSLGAMTKSAQLPFQSWLLGAMVAPTPVSALLHSSTMVKAGSYLILRLAPHMAGTMVAQVVTIAGAFTFAVTSALAIGQSNGKRVLAYSTIANLGLIAACAGINTPLAYAAALMLLLFHAISKALLFLCVGTIEQTIGSRHIEDMGGILFKMPLTTNIAIIGMVSMMVPPFGMLIGKWMAIESSVHTPAALMLFVLGSALTIFFWAKWLGRITTASYHPAFKIEKVSPWMLSVLTLMAGAVVVCSFAAMPLYHYVIKPLSADVFAGHSADQSLATLLDSVDRFMGWPFFVALALVLLSVGVSLALLKRTQVRLPFLCGENVEGGAWSFEFRSLMDRKEVALLNSYYMSPVFGESAITRWANPVAAMIVLTLLGVVFI